MQHRSRALLALALGLPAAVQAAEVPTKGLDQDVVVLCLRFPDRPDIGRTCQEWVDRLNETARPWYAENSHGVTSFRFRLPTVHAGQALPADGWLPITRPDSMGMFIGDLNSVLPDVDPVVDFSTTDRMVVLGNSTTFFGQATGGNGPGQPFLSTLSANVDEHNEEELRVEGGVEDFRRRIATVLMWEGRYFDGPDEIDPMTGMIEAEATIIHELGHLLGLPDRYGGYSFPSPRNVVSWYDPMSSTAYWQAMPHWLGMSREELGFVHAGQQPITLTRGQSATILVAPGWMDPLPAGATPLVKIPLQNNAASPFEGILIEARQEDFHSTSPRDPLLVDRVPRDGVLLSWGNFTLFEGGRQLTLIDNPNHPGDQALAPLKVGEVYEDNGQGVRIEVLSEEPEGYLIGIDVVQPGALLPDVGILPWNTDRWETEDIWVDNQVNGYGTFEHLTPSGAPDGNGDRPQPGVENRIFFRIHNFGTADANNVFARVEAAYPGIGDAQVRWSQVWSGYIPHIPAGGEIVSFVNWTPPTEHGGHACLKVQVSPLPGEPETANNSAQENIFEFETTHNSPWKPKAQRLTVANPFDDRDLQVLVDVSGLPDGWGLRLEPAAFVLGPSEKKEVEFELLPAGTTNHPTSGYEEGEIYEVSVQAQGWEDKDDPQGTVHLLGGVMALTQLTVKETLDVKVKDKAGTSATLTGCLLPGVSGAKIALVATNPQGTKAVSHATTGSNGCYTIPLKGSKGSWQVQALYDGVMPRGSAESGVLTVKF